MILFKQIRYKYYRASVIFDVIESGGIFDALNQFLPVFDVGSVVSNFGVENVFEALLSHELIWKNANAFFYLMVQILRAPHLTQPLNWINFLFGPPNLHHEVRKVYAHLGRQLSWQWWFLDESEYGLAIVLGNVLGIVPQTRVMADPIFGKFLSFWVLKINLFSNVVVSTFFHIFSEGRATIDLLKCFKGVGSA